MEENECLCWCVRVGVCERDIKTESERVFVREIACACVRERESERASEKEYERKYKKITAQMKD